MLFFNNIDLLVILRLSNTGELSKWLLSSYWIQIPLEELIVDNFYLAKSKKVSPIPIASIGSIGAPNIAKTTATTPVKFLK